MPVTKHKRKVTMKTLCLTLLALSVLSLLSFVSGGDYRNTFVFVGLCVAGVYSAALMLTEYSRRKQCNIYTRATVRDIITQGSATYLQLEYSVLGQPVTGLVRFYESELPSRGQDTGVYYSESSPSVCMLRMYKERRVGWSKRTGKSYVQNATALMAASLFFFGVGIFMIYIVGVRTAEYSESTCGTVVGYMEQYDSHTIGVPGTYEYSPYIQLEVDGISYTAKALSLSMRKGYSIGDVLTVHYAPGNPESVIVEGDNTHYAVVIGFLLLGSFTTWAAVCELRSLRKEREALGNNVYFT